MNKWIIYEAEKKKLQAMDLTPEEYEKAVRELCEKLRI
jgi:hypothetical protein